MNDIQSNYYFYIHLILHEREGKQFCCKEDHLFDSRQNMKLGYWLNWWSKMRNRSVGWIDLVSLSADQRESWSLRCLLYAKWALFAKVKRHPFLIRLHRTLTLFKFPYSFPGIARTSSFFCTNFFVSQKWMYLGQDDSMLFPDIDPFPAVRGGTNYVFPFGYWLINY